MMAPEKGVPVKRVQAALIELGRSVGPAGADGIFGTDTGAAVSAYKAAKGLSPTDPVVGAGTSKALDDDLFFNPPTLDPAFAEFSPMVMDHRVEPFAALELAALVRAPLNSWRHMLGLVALDALNSGELLGIVIRSRAIQLRDTYLQVADAVQPSGETAEILFDDAIVAADDVARTITFHAGGSPRSFILIGDDVVLGRAFITRLANGTRARLTLLGTIVHELTHARNVAGSLALRQTADTDTNAYADTALAQARSAAQGPTANVLQAFVAEMLARHVHWIVLQELAGTPGGLALSALPSEELAAAALFYFVEFPLVFDSNGYGAGINAQGDAVRFRQLELWLNLCAAQSFSDDAAADQQATQVFLNAAGFCADQIVNPVLEFPEENGLFPLPADFH